MDKGSHEAREGIVRFERNISRNLMLDPWSATPIFWITERRG
ncbi:MAG: hypothetical protein SWK76_07530 [Actinomycetota bacterium]|nr:hypothetical protein [Actinomycetota bacterium]